MSVIDQIRSRRSIRQFQTDPVPSDILNEILEAGVRAPSAGNLQTYSVIVTQDSGKRRMLYDIHFRQEMFLQAPVVLTVCADVYRNSRWMELRGAEPGFENLWGFLVGMADGWSFAENVCLAAHSLGLGSCHSGGTFEKVLNLVDLFKCPKGVIPVATIVLGYPGIEVDSTQRIRLDTAALLHREEYKAMDRGALEVTYRGKEAADGLVYVKAFPRLPEGVRSLADIYARMKYPKSDMDLFGENYLTALRKQGFLPQGA